MSIFMNNTIVKGVKMNLSIFVYKPTGPKVLMSFCDPFQIKLLYKYLILRGLSHEITYHAKIQYGYRIQCLIIHTPYLIGGTLGVGNIPQYLDSGMTPPNVDAKHGCFLKM